MSAPAPTTTPVVPSNGPMSIRTLYSGDRLVLGALVVDARWRMFNADQTLQILTTAATQRVQLEARGVDGTEITTPAGPMALQFYSDIDVGIVETLAPGSPVEVFSTGEPPALTFNFRIPKGERGTPGQQGDPGQVSIGQVETLAPGSAATANIDGPPTGKVLSLGIPRGATGATGAAATKPVFKIGTVATTDNNGSASVAIRTDPADASGNSYLLDLTMPKGPKGDTGSVSSGQAGGHLTGNYPNPELSATAKALFEPAGAVKSSMDAHKAESDPHGYKAYVASQLGATSTEMTALKKAAFGDSTRTKRPNNIVYLGSNLNYTSGLGDYFAQNGWVRDSASTDPAQMFVSTAAGQYSYLMAPVAGRYCAHFHVQAVAGSRLVWASCSMTKDDRNMSSNAIASDSGDGDANSFLALDAWNDQVYLTAGQKVYWSIWGDDPYQVRAIYQGLRSFVSLRYLGPE